MFEQVAVRLAALLVLATGSVSPAVAQVPQPVPKNDPDVAKVLGLLERADKLLQTYAVQADLDFFEQGKKKTSMTFLLAIAPESTVALFKKPAYDNGKIVLFNENGYFFYFPGPDRYIRVSPQNSLFGNISLGDIVKPPLLRYYEVKEAQRQADLLEVSFVLRDGVSLPYHRKLIRVDLKRNLIKEIESYSHSGILLGKTINLEFIDVKGIPFPAYSKILDVKKSGGYAFQRNSSLRIVDLPKKLFNPAFLREVDGALGRHFDL